jgi:heat shock protein HslJ
MRREQRFLAMLANIRLAQGSHRKLILKKEDGKVLADGAT